MVEIGLSVILSILTRSLAPLQLPYIATIGLLCSLILSLATLLYVVPHIITPDSTSVNMYCGSEVEVNCGHVNYYCQIPPVWRYCCLYFLDY